MYWLNGKQCKPWCSSGTVWSGLILFPQSSCPNTLSKYAYLFFWPLPLWQWLKCMKIQQKILTIVSFSRFRFLFGFFLFFSFSFSFFFTLTLFLNSSKNPRNAFITIVPGKDSSNFSSRHVAFIVSSKFANKSRYFILHIPSFCDCNTTEIGNTETIDSDKQSVFA